MESNSNDYLLNLSGNCSTSTNIGAINSTGNGDTLWISDGGTTARILQPLDVYWKPKEDITVYELAKCMPFILKRGYVMPLEWTDDESVTRHFEVFDPNK